MSNVAADQIAPINKDLANLLKRVNTIYIITGGKTPNKKNKNISDSTKIQLKLDNINKIKDIFDKNIYTPDSRTYIQLKYQLKNELLDVAQLLQSSKDIDPSIISEAQQHIPKQHTPKNLGITTDDLISGKMTNMKQEEITEHHQIMLNEIDNEEKVQDEIIDNISNLVQDLLKYAHNIGDEIQTQNQIIDDVIQKTDNVTIKIEGANERLLIINKINNNSSKYISYIICLIILGVLLYVFSKYI